MSFRRRSQVPTIRVIVWEVMPVATAETVIMRSHSQPNPDRETRMCDICILRRRFTSSFHSSAFHPGNKFPFSIYVATFLPAQPLNYKCANVHCSACKRALKVLA